MEIISVIVPIYNAQKYLENCIISILNQSYSNLEIILIDDGSTDGSGKICDAYKEKDARIKVIHKSNEGLVSARIEGIQISKGNLITFVDSDDVIEDDMYERMMEIYDSEKPDIISSGLKVVDECNNEILYEELDEAEEGIYNRAQIEKKILERMMWDEHKAKRAITSSVCTKIFKKKLLQEIVDKIDTKLTLGEDAAITYPCLALAKKIMIFHRSWYHYVYRENSMVRTKRIGDFEKIYLLKKCLENQFGEKSDIASIKYQIERYTKVFLNQSIQQLFQVDMVEVDYLFPYSVIPKGSRIVIYGAGRVGKSYWRCLKDDEYAEVVAIVDKNYMNVSLRAMSVESPCILQYCEYDFVLIAVNEEYMSNEIREVLKQQLVKPEKIIWKKPQYVG